MVGFPSGGWWKRPKGKNLMQGTFKNGFGISKILSRRRKFSSSRIHLLVVVSQGWKRKLWDTSFNPSCGKIFYLPESQEAPPMENSLQTPTGNIVGSSLFFWPCLIQFPPIHAFFTLLWCFGVGKSGKKVTGVGKGCQKARRAWMPCTLC